MYPVACGNEALSPNPWDKLDPNPIQLTLIVQATFSPSLNEAG